MHSWASNLTVWQRLSVKTNLKLAKLWLDRKEYSRLAKAGLLILLCARTAHVFAAADQGPAYLH